MQKLFDNFDSADERKGFHFAFNCVDDSENHKYEKSNADDPADDSADNGNESEDKTNDCRGDIRNKKNKSLVCVITCECVIFCAKNCYDAENPYIRDCRKKFVFVFHKIASSKKWYQ